MFVYAVMGVKYDYHHDEYSNGTEKVLIGVFSTFEKAVAAYEEVWFKYDFDGMEHELVELDVRFLGA